MTEFRFSKSKILSLGLVGMLLSTGLGGGYMLGASDWEIPGSPSIQSGDSSRIGSAEAAREFGLPKAQLTAELAADSADLYSPSLTGSGTDYSFRSEDWNLNLQADRILPVSQAVELGADWSAEKKRSFGADLANVSMTSSQANSWKSDSTPADILEARNSGEVFEWTESCAADYRGVFPSGPGCGGIPSDFDSCSYAERYESVADRYELKLPRNDLRALKALSESC